MDSNRHTGTDVSNAASIAVPGTGTGPAIASPYPSTISVSGVTGSVTKVKVKLNNFTHTFWDDVGILLVGPLGQKVLLTSDNGGANERRGRYVFDASAVNAVPDNAVVRRRPTNPRQTEVIKAEVQQCRRTFRLRLRPHHIQELFLRLMRSIRTGLGVFIFMMIRQLIRVQ